MPADDFLAGASLPDVSVDTEGALVRTRHEGARRRRRRAVMAGAGVVVALAAGVGAGVQLVGADGGDREPIVAGEHGPAPDDPAPATPSTTDPPPDTTTSTTSTTSTAPTTAEPSGPPAPGTDECTREAVAASNGYRLDEVLSDPVCDSAWGWVDVCPASEVSTEGCVHSGKIIRLQDDRWTVVGALLQDCAESFTAVGAPMEVAERFYPSCFPPDA